MPSESFTMIHESCRAKLQYISKQIDNNLINICLRSKVQQIIEITTQKNETYLPEERNSFAWQPARLLTLCQLRNFCVSLLKSVSPFFDQSSHTIYLTWYRSLLFFWECSSIIPFMV